MSEVVVRACLLVAALAVFLLMAYFAYVRVPDPLSERHVRRQSNCRAYMWWAAGAVLVAALRLALVIH